MTASSRSTDLPITVMIVDDHPLLRDGIAVALSNESDLKLIADAADGPSAIECFRTYRPDVTLMDVQLPGMSGLDALRAIRAEFEDARIIMLTTYRGDVQIATALQYGACGFLLKSSLRKELRDAIRAVHAGRRAISAEVAVELAEHVGSDALSERELDVLRSVARGNANKVIAKDLRISEFTVKAHVQNILSKLDARDRTHAVIIAVKRGIIDV